MTFPTPSTDLSYILLYGYPALFLLIFLSEFTSFLPIGIVLIGVGALAKAHLISFWISLAVATLAGMAGDVFVFLISRKLGKRESYRRFVEKSHFAKRLEGYVRKNPKATIFLSRLVGLASTPVNALAGLSQMHMPTFLVFDALGEALCAGIYLTAGYLIGAAWQQDAKITSIGIGVALAIGALGYLISTHLRARKQLPPR